MRLHIFTDTVYFKALFQSRTITIWSKADILTEDLKRILAQSYLNFTILMSDGFLLFPDLLLQNEFLSEGEQHRGRSQ